MSDLSQGPGWWQASDGKWYPPQATGGAGNLASFGQRAIAVIFDMLITIGVFIPVIIVVLIGFALSNILGVLLAVVGYAAAFVFGLYLYWLQGEVGGTPAKRLLGLKVVKEDTGQPTGGGMGIVRQIAHMLDSFLCYIGYLFPLWDAKRQTFADKIIGTVVLADQPKMDFGADIFKS